MIFKPSKAFLFLVGHIVPDISTCCVVVSHVDAAGFAALVVNGVMEYFLDLAPSPPEMEGYFANLKSRGRRAKLYRTGIPAVTVGEVAAKMFSAQKIS